MGELSFQRRSSVRQSERDRARSAKLEALVISRLHSDLMRSPLGEGEDPCKPSDEFYRAAANLFSMDYIDGLFPTQSPFFRQEIHARVRLRLAEMRLKAAANPDGVRSILHPRIKEPLRGPQAPRERSQDFPLEEVDPDQLDRR